MSREENAAETAKSTRHERFVQLRRDLEELACRITDPDRLRAERKRLIDEYEAKIRRASVVERVAAAKRQRPSLLRPPTARADTTARVEMASLTAHPNRSEMVQARAARLQVVSGQPPTQQRTQVITAQKYTEGRPSPSGEERRGSPDDKINFLEAEYHAQTDECGNFNVAQNQFQTGQYTAPPGIQDTPLALLNVSSGGATPNARISTSGQAAICPPGSTSRPRATGIPRPGGSRQIPGSATSRLPCPPGQRVAGATGIPSTTKQSTQATQKRMSTTPALCPVTRTLPRPSGAIPKPAASRQSTATDTKLTETGARKSLVASRTSAATAVTAMSRKSLGLSAAGPSASTSTTKMQTATQKVTASRKSLPASRQSSSSGICPPAKTATAAGRQTMVSSTGRSGRALSTTKMRATDAAAKGATARKSLPASRAQGRQIETGKLITSGKRLMTSFGPIEGLSQIAFSRPVDRKRYFKNIAQTCNEDLESVEPPEYEDYLDVCPTSPATHRVQSISNWLEEEFAILEQNVLGLQQQVTDPEALQSQLTELMDVFERKLKEARIIQHTDVRQQREMAEVCPPPAAETPALAKQALPSKLSGPKATASKKSLPASGRATTAGVCPPGRASIALRRQTIAPPTDAARRISEARKSIGASRRASTASVCPPARTSTVARRQTIAPPTDAARRISEARKSMGASRRASTASVCPPGRTSIAVRRQTIVPPTDAARRMSEARKSMEASRRASTVSVCPPARTSTVARRQTIAPPTGRPSALGRITSTTQLQMADAARRMANVRKSMGASQRASTASVCPPARTSTATRRQTIAPSTDVARRISEARKSMGVSRRASTASVCPPARMSTAVRRQTTAPSTGRPSAFGRTISTAKRQSTDVALRTAASRKSLPASRQTSTATVCPPGRTSTATRRQTIAPPTDAARRMSEVRKSIGASRRASTASVCPPARMSTAARRQTIAPSTGHPSAFGRTISTAKRQSTGVALRPATSRKSLPASRRASTAGVCPPAKTATAARRQTIAASAAPGKAKSTTKVQAPDARKSMAVSRRASTAAVTRRQTTAPSSARPTAPGAASRRASTAAVARRQTIGPSSARSVVPGKAKSTTKMQPPDATTKAATRKSMVARGRSIGAARPSGVGPKKRLMTSFGPIEGMSELTFSRPVERKRYFKRIGEEYEECLEDFAPPPFDYELEGEPRPPGTERPLPIKVGETSRRQSSADKSLVTAAQAAAKVVASKKIEKTWGPHKSTKSMKKPTTSIQKRPRTIAGPVCPAAPRSTKAVQKKVDSEILGGLKSRHQKGHIQQQKNLKLLRSQVLAGKGGPGKPEKPGKDEDDKKKRRQSSRFEPMPGPSGVGKAKVTVKQPSIAAKKIHREIKKKVEESQKSMAPKVSRTAKPKSLAPMPAKKAGSEAPKAVSRPAGKRESILKSVAGDLAKRVAEQPGGPPIEKEETDEAFRIMALERKGMNLTGDPKDVANLLVPSNEPKLNAVGNAIESVNEGIVTANIPTSKINALNNLATEEIGITLRSHPQPTPQTGLAAATLEKVLLQLPAAPQCDYLECEVVLSNFTVENCFQPRGSAMPKWFPGMYTILPGEKNVMARTSPSNTLMKAWNELKPEFLKV